MYVQNKLNCHRLRFGSLTCINLISYKKMFNNGHVGGGLTGKGHGGGGGRDHHQGGGKGEGEWQGERGSGRSKGQVMKIFVAFGAGSNPLVF
jgi:hypothetical protein